MHSDDESADSGSLDKHESDYFGSQVLPRTGESVEITDEGTEGYTTPACQSPRNERERERES